MKVIPFHAVIPEVVFRLKKRFPENGLKAHNDNDRKYRRKLLSRQNMVYNFFFSRPMQKVKLILAINCLD